MSEGVEGSKTKRRAFDSFSTTGYIEIGRMGTIYENSHSGPYSKHPRMATRVNRDSPG